MTHINLTYTRRSFVREIYDGQLFIKLKKGLDLPAMDPWVGYFFHVYRSNCKLSLSRGMSTAAHLYHLHLISLVLSVS
jgi:hypothetical protein